MKNLLYIIYATALFYFAGCCTCKNSTQSEQKSLQPFTISLISGGGATGFRSGYILYSDGVISRSGKFLHEQEKIDTIDTKHPKEIHEIKKLIDEKGLSKLSIKGTGNMTTTLTVTEGDESYFLSWSGSFGEPDMFQKEISPVAEKILDLVKKVETERMNKK